MLRALIIDDELNGRKILNILLSEHCPEVEILGSCNSVDEAKKMIRLTRPNLLFLDIKLGGENGFDLLEKYPFPSDNIHVVFTTAYSEFAIKAIKNDAIDYLLKPIDVNELKSSVNKVKNRIGYGSNTTATNKQSPTSFAIPKIKLVNREGFELIELKDILYCKSEINYTRFYLKNRKPILTSKTLKSYQEYLEQNGFLRVHKSYVVNLNEITKFSHGKVAIIHLTTNETINVGKEYKAKLLERLDP